VAYPYAKRAVSLPQAVLGLAFSFGIPMAFAAAHGGEEFSLHAVGEAVPNLAWALLAGNLFWVLAYDTEYAMVDRDDDVRLGIKTSALTLGEADVAAVMGFYAIYLLSWGVVGKALGLGWVYGLGIMAAAAQALWHHRLIKDRSREGCFKAFRLNHWLGFTVFLGVAADLAWR
jgi:4-hydroxybenzoate polyprenyltransferase